MLRPIIWVVSLCLIFQTATIESTLGDGHAPFPQKRIRLVVYTKPGGAIDTTARKFEAIAKKYTDATFVVENKPGAGGIVAMKDVLQSKPDGYALLACTKSNVAKIVAAGDTSLISAFHWIAMMVADPECVITRRDVPPSTWDELLADARQKKGRQVWAGPAFGGLDHVTAMKAWEAAGISAVWIPFQSGGKAKAELLGGRSVAYVGNPNEIRANPDKMRVAAVASTARLPEFPDAPTFAELGVDGLTDDVMWRGFALRTGTPSEIVAWYETLFRQVSADPEWRSFFEKDGIRVAFVDSDAFTERVDRDRQEFTTYLGRLGVLPQDGSRALTQFFGSVYPLALLAALSAATFLAFRVLGPSRQTGGDVGPLMIPAVLLFGSGILFCATCAFPKTDEVGAAAMPRLWLCVLVPLCVVLVAQARRNRSRETGVPLTDAKQTPSEDRIERRHLVGPFVAMLLAYVVAMPWLGYYVSTSLFLFVAIRWLGELSWTRVTTAVCGWLVFSYLLFARMLVVPLPVGKFIERFL